MDRLKSEVCAMARGSSTTVAAGRDALGATTTTTTPCLRAVVKEAMSLHPPVRLLLPRRECMRDTTALGFHVARAPACSSTPGPSASTLASWSTPDECGKTAASKASKARKNAREQPGCLSGAARHRRSDFSSAARRCRGKDGDEQPSEAGPGRDA